MPAGAGVEQADGRRVTADLEWLLNQSSHLGQGFTPGAAPSPGSSVALFGSEQRGRRWLHFSRHP